MGRSAPRAAVALAGGLALGLLGYGCAGHILPGTPGVHPIAADSIETSLFLLGDGGSPAAGGDPVLLALGRELRKHPARSVVLFLGDNVYPVGIPEESDPTYAEARRHLVAQVETVREAGARGYVIPGNHDWRRGREGGLDAVRRADLIADSTGAGLVVQLPDRGCPGPVVVDVGTRLRLVLLDTQWWLQSNARPEGAECRPDAGVALDSIRAALAGGAGRTVVVAGHHPLVSGGEHGGFFEWKDHIFPLRHVVKWLWLPLPVIGSAYPIARTSGITDQDFAGGRYRALRDSMAAAFRDNPPHLYASGHDHSLQVIDSGPARMHVISGGGYYGHVDPVTSVPGTRVAISASGFMLVEVATDGRARLAVHTVAADGSTTEVYSAWLEN